MTGKLTTHVLDTAQGCPAVGMAIALYAVNPDSGDKALLKQMTTNSEGRTDAPLLADDDLEAGVYELVFSVGDYFLRHNPDLAQPLFLNRVPLQFGIANPSAHYHVPLLASPWSYSTYRGS